MYFKFKTNYVNSDNLKCILYSQFFDCSIKFQVARYCNCSSSSNDKIYVVYLITFISSSIKIVIFVFSVYSTVPSNIKSLIGRALAPVKIPISSILKAK